MVALCFLLLALIVLALGALRWDASSSDGVESAEWQRRQQGYGLHYSCYTYAIKSFGRLDMRTQAIGLESRSVERNRE